MTDLSHTKPWKTQREGFLDSLNPIIQKNAESTFKKYNDFYVGEVKIEK